ncbi:hypothetical protein D4764_11G0005160 [Takifugu flavidus]|uniref:Uncharacterized protein n=1 Tax=Takifugu flavidus TaxID=433684 RepID=A0A5C6PG82_9TELE|nr:hypothetical protein D4764_11G0005160 [Takifugu flavidus]
MRPIEKEMADEAYRISHILQPRCSNDAGGGKEEEEEEEGRQGGSSDVGLHFDKKMDPSYPLLRPFFREPRETQTAARFVPDFNSRQLCFPLGAKGRVWTGSATVRPLQDDTTSGRLEVKLL